MFVEPSYEDKSYAKNLRTGEKWIAGEVEEYGIFNLLTGGRHSEYDQIQGLKLLGNSNYYRRIDR